MLGAMNPYGAEGPPTQFQLQAQWSGEIDTTPDAFAGESVQEWIPSISWAAFLLPTEQGAHYGCSRATRTAHLAAVPMAAAMSFYEEHPECIKQPPIRVPDFESWVRSPISKYEYGRIKELALGKRVSSIALECLQLLGAMNPYGKEGPADGEASSSQTTTGWLDGDGDDARDWYERRAAEVRRLEEFDRRAAQDERDWYELGASGRMPDDRAWFEEWSSSDQPVSQEELAVRWQLFEAAANASENLSVREWYAPGGPGHLPADNGPVDDGPAQDTDSKPTRKGPPKDLRWPSIAGAKSPPPPPPSSVPPPPPVAIRHVEVDNPWWQWCWCCGARSTRRVLRVTLLLIVTCERLHLVPTADG